MAVAERLEKGSVAVIVATGQDERSALDILFHDFEKLANLVIGPLFAVTDVGERVKRLGAAEAAAKLGQGGIVGDWHGAGSMKRPRQSLNAEDDMNENGVDV